MLDADEGDVNFPGSGCSRPVIRADADVRKYIYAGSET